MDTLGVIDPVAEQKKASSTMQAKIIPVPAEWVW